MEGTQLTGQDRPLEYTVLYCRRQDLKTYYLLYPCNL